MLRIFADENIVSVADLMAPLGRVTTLHGRQITTESLKESDILLVRSITRVDAGLVEGTPIKFVGSATAGIDHIDTEALRRLGIRFEYAPGCNATSVGDYVVSAILHLAIVEGRELHDLTCAVVGCGAVGGKLARRLENLGLTVLRSDPPLKEKTGRGRTGSPFVDTDEAIALADVVTLHVPLHDVAPYSTFGLLNDRRLRLLKNSAWVINTSRGLVVDEAALSRWLMRNQQGRAVLDVWADEPQVPCSLVERASIATAHIAGYAAEGKTRATIMLRNALFEWVHKKPVAPGHDQKTIALAAAPPGDSGDETGWLYDLARSAYDITADHERFVAVCRQPESEQGPFFDALRRNYPVRHEMSCFRIPKSIVPSHLERAVAGGLEFKVE